MNLFPFLPLDGGHIFWAIVEKVRRQPVPYSVMERAGVVGFMLVIVLFVIGLSNDIGRINGGGLQERAIVRAVSEEGVGDGHDRSERAGGPATRD